MNPMRCARSIPSLLLGLTLALTACATPRITDAGGDGAAGDPIATTEPDDYARVFDAARTVLRDYRFAIDRVDARSGVITTHPKRTAGLATIWDREQSSPAQEWEDLINEQRRAVRVEFDRADDGSASARVIVEVLRTHRPNWRVENESVRMSTHARSRNSMGQSEPPSFREPMGLDPALAARLASAIDERLSDGRVRDEAGGP